METIEESKRLVEDFGAYLQRTRRVSMATAEEHATAKV
jgi:hypothetical protein